MPIEMSFVITKKNSSSLTAPTCSEVNAFSESQNTRPLLGAYVPQCDVTGNYANKQCHPSTGYCWCVDTQTGQQIEGTKKRGELKCGKFVPFTHSHCCLHDMKAYPSLIENSWSIILTMEALFNTLV